MCACCRLELPHHRSVQASTGTAPCCCYRHCHIWTIALFYPHRGRPSLRTAALSALAERLPSSRKRKSRYAVSLCYYHTACILPCLRGGRTQNPPSPRIFRFWGPRSRQTLIRATIDKFWSRSDDALLSSAPY